MAVRRGGRGAALVVCLPFFLCRTGYETFKHVKMGSLWDQRAGSGLVSAVMLEIYHRHGPLQFGFTEGSPRYP